jgi:hypothetical protein
MSLHSRAQEIGSTRSAGGSCLRSILFPFQFDDDHTGGGATRRAGRRRERLAKRAAALPHERRMSLLWTNHSALSEQRAERLRVAFAAQIEAAQVRLAQGETAPALRVAIEQTPTQIVFTATVPGEGSTSVAIEEVTRSAAGIDASPGNSVRLEKELLWQQRDKNSECRFASSWCGWRKVAWWCWRKRTCWFMAAGLGTGD